MHRSGPRLGLNHQGSSRGRRRASSLRPAALLVAGSGLLLTAAPTRAGDDKPGGEPTLDAPLLAPGVPAPAPVAPAAPATPILPEGTAPAAPAVSAPTPSRSSAVLAIPGLVRPGLTARSAPTQAAGPELAAPRLGSESISAGPVGRLSLEPPLAEYGREGLPAALPGEADNGRVIVSRPAGSEPGSANEPSLDVPTLGTRDEPRPPADPFPLRTLPSTSGTKPPHRIEPKPRDVRDSAGATPAPKRRLFGLLPPSPAATRSYTAQRPVPGRELASTPESTNRDDPEAAAQEALRRRIEKQARLYAGDRARSVEVHLDKKQATVRASGVRFYQKKAVRRSLETLPALSGLHATIEVLD